MPGHLKGGALRWLAVLGINLALAKDDLPAAAAELATRLDAAIKDPTTAKAMGKSLAAPAGAGAYDDSSGAVAESGGGGCPGGVEDIAAVVVGAETGVRLSDVLIEAVNALRSASGCGLPPLRGNASSGSEARRDKCAQITAWVTGITRDAITRVGKNTNRLYSAFIEEPRSVCVCV